MEKTEVKRFDVQKPNMVREIQKWLAEFRDAWKSSNIDSVMTLFTDDVVYYETPSKKLESKKELKEEWKAVREQKNVSLDFEVFSQDKGKFTVQWSLSYQLGGQKKDLKGVYLIKLNENNKCSEFWQYCQNE